MESKNVMEADSSRGHGGLTTPGQLQDVTMDDSISFGFRSPSSFSVGGQGSPGQAKSMRDYEEQITTLQRENFNLRLRIYFLEEKLNGSGMMGQGTESLFKQNIDLKVEIEVMKKELQEKDDLLTQAANTMKRTESIQKSMKEEAKVTESELKSRIDMLELEISEMQKIYGPAAASTNLISLVEGDGANSRRIFSGFSSEAELRIHDLQQKIDQLNQMNAEMKESMTELEAMHQEKALKIKDFEVKTGNLTCENSQLKENIEVLEQNTKLTEELKVQLFELREQLAEKMCDQQDLEARLQEKTKAYETSCAAIQKLLKTMKESKDVSRNDQTHAEKEEMIQMLKGQLESKDLEVTSLRAEILRTIELKNAEIFELKSEVKRKNTNLQRLVNKDLWDKNREIERLMCLQNKRNGSREENPVKLTKDVEQLESQFTEAQYNEALERNVQLEKKLNTLRQTLCLNDNSTEISQLKLKLQEAEMEAENAHKWRKECADLCSILTLRLEELAGFLDSLLKHKDVLGALCADRRHAMRKAIDRSLDLSRSINNNSSLNLGTTLSEQSLMQMTGFSAILDDTFPDSLDNVNVVEALRAEVRTLRTELERSYKRNEVTKKRSSLGDGGHSESESWSEPDRNVSAARIGLEDSRNSKASHQSKSYNSSTDEDSASVTPMKKTLAADKISQLETLVTEKENKLLEMQMSFVEMENAKKEECFRLSEQLHATEEDLATQKALNDKLKEEIADLQRSLFVQKDLKEEIDQLKCDLVEKIENLNTLTKERDATAVDLRVAEMKMETMAKDMEYQREKHVKDIAVRLENARKEFLLEMEAQLQRQDLQHQETLNKDYVSKVIFNQKSDEVDVLRRRLTDARATVDGMSEAEIELRALLSEHERKAREMQKSLTDATMQASGAVLERSRAVSERGQMEAALKDLQARYDSLMMEKTDLNGRIGQLENLTATLQNHLVKVTVKNESRERSSDDGERLNNSSPDLGVDSDVAGASSSDAAVRKPQPRLSSVSTLEMKSLLKSDHDCLKIEEENSELKKRLIRTRRQLEDTVRRLKQSNKQKEQIEHDIQMQIQKTHSVLKQVRSNMETEAEKRNIPLPARPSDNP